MDSDTTADCDGGRTAAKLYQIRMERDIHLKTSQTIIRTILVQTHYNASLFLPIWKSSLTCLSICGTGEYKRIASLIQRSK